MGFMRKGRNFRIFLLALLLSINWLLIGFPVKNIQEVKAATLFSDGFESGNLSAWSSSAIDGGNLSAAAAAALHGSYGLSSVINDTTSIYVQDDTPNTKKRLRLRFYIDPNGLTMANNNQFRVYAAYNSSWGNTFFIYFTYKSSAYNISVYNQKDSGSIDTAMYVITDEPHWIEVDWKASSATGANDGTTELIIDGVSKETITGIDNDTKEVSNTRFGASYGIDAGTSGTFYLDDFVSNDDGSSIGPVADTSVPTPNPMTFSTSPANDSASQISMTASTATDDTPPVNYFFTNDNSSCGANGGTGGTSSSWQASTSYSDSGLQPNQCYGYTVTARDSVTPTPNTGTASSISSTYTSANTPGTPALGSATFTTLALTNDANSNPASNPTTNFAVQVVTATPSDATWLNKWVDASGNPSDTAVWQTDLALDALVLAGLNSGTTYGVKVKARNQDNDETALSAEGQGATTAVVVSVSVTDGGVVYGLVTKGQSKDTTSNGLNDTQTATNDGNVTENFNIMGQNSASWTLGATAGNEQYVHEFCKTGTGSPDPCDTSPTWTALTTNYQSLGTGITASGTQRFDLKITLPTSTTSTAEQSVNVTIQAVQQ